MSGIQTKPPLVDNPAITDLYVDDGWFAFEESRGILNFTFTVARVGDEKETKTKGRFVVARLAMPLQSALALHRRLEQLVQHLAAKGQLQRIAEPPKLKQ